MNKGEFLQLLKSYQPCSEETVEAYKRMRQLAEESEDCFDRNFFKDGHFTAAAWILNPERDKALLVHHKKLDRWLQPGGHLEDDRTILDAALREAREETGIEDIAPISTEIFDIDVHAIPEHKSVPAHYHYDVRFLFQAENTDFTVSDESHEVRWFSAEEMSELDLDKSVLRMIGKWIVLAADQE